MSQNWKIVVIIVAFLVILSTILYVQSISQNYIVRLTDPSELTDLSNAFVYFGRENCPSCELFFPLLEKVSSNERIEVYYFDTNYFRDHALLTETELQAILTEYRVEEVPVIILIEDGKVTGAYGANFTIEQADNIQKDILEFLTYSEKPAKYIPQYTVLLVLCLMSVITMLVPSFCIITKRKLSQKTMFSLRLMSTSVLIMLLTFVSPTLNYISNNQLSLMPIMGVIFFISILFSTMSHIFLSKKTLLQKAEINQ